MYYDRLEFCTNMDFKNKLSTFIIRGGSRFLLQRGRGRGEVHVSAENQARREILEQGHMIIFIFCPTVYS